MIDWLTAAAKAITRRYDEIDTDYLVPRYEIFIAARSTRNSFVNL